VPWIIGGAILGSSLLGADAAEDAADIQAKGADKSLRLQERMFDETQNNLSPWMGAGRVSLSELNRLIGLGGSGGAQEFDDRTKGSNLSRDQFDAAAYLRQNPDVAAARVDPWKHYMEYGRFEDRTFGRTPDSVQAAPQTNLPAGYLTKPFSMQDFQESPAYQFNLQQGQKAIENAAAKNKTLYAPATLQDIGRFSQGLASNEFQNAFSNYNTNLNNIWSRLYAMSGSGQNAAAQLGGFGTTVAGQMGDTITSGAASQAAGRVGAANAISGGVGTGVNAYLMNQFLQGSQAPSVSLRSLPSMTGANDIGGYFA
jgi:hypothetical protein